MLRDEKPPIPRELRALTMLEAGVRVAEAGPGEYLVPSESGVSFYRVTLQSPPDGQETCSCPDFEDRRAWCKHLFLVREWLSSSSETEAKLAAHVHPRRIRPNAPAFSKAQMEEGRLFPVLLRMLINGAEVPVRNPHRAGRPAIPLRDQIFCAVQKVYSGFSGRRSKEHRVQAAEEGFIEATPYFDVVSKFLCREEATPILLDIVARSALPFRAIEERCAIDSTGFRTTRFHYYRNEKYTPTRKNEWLKAHALVGIQTHAIIAVEVTSGNAGDAPQFGPLLNRAAHAGFQLKEVLADRAYNSRANFEIAKDLGMTAYIPFKRNQTGQSRGSLTYHQMFLFFAYHREKFDEHYRHRGQVEVAFGALKQVIGEGISSLKFTAQQNELLCKAIAWNITMLIHAMYGIGLLPDFLQPGEGPQASGPVPTASEDIVQPDLSLIPSEPATSVVLSSAPR
jgi:hypothetical protein